MVSALDTEMYEQGRRVNFLFGVLNFYLRLGSILFNFILGGLAHCTVQSVSLFFARLNFIWGALAPSPNDAPPLRTRYVYEYIRTVSKSTIEPTIISHCANACTLKFVSVLRITILLYNEYIQYVTLYLYIAAVNFS